MDKDKIENVIAIIAICMIIGAGMTASFSPVSGYQSMTAQWHSVRWPNAQDSGELFVMPLNGTTFSWNPDNIYADSDGLIPDGMSDLPTIAGEVENPKFDRNIEYHDWWDNDTVSASNPNGTAMHYEWAIDIYTSNVVFRAVGGQIAFSTPPRILVELENNFDSVFSVLGAEFAASYVIYAQTQNYTWVPADAGWHIISPTVGNFELIFLGNPVAPPMEFEEGSELNFANLASYANVALPFELTEFGTALWGSAPVVTMVVELNVLTVGRFDHVLTYVSGGDNQIAPIGSLGVLASMSAAIAAGFGALMDGFAGLGSSLFAPLLSLGMIVVGAVILVIIIRRKRQ